VGNQKKSSWMIKGRRDQWAKAQKGANLMKYTRPRRTIVIHGRRQTKRYSGSVKRLHPGGEGGLYRAKKRHEKVPKEGIVNRV